MTVKCCLEMLNGRFGLRAHVKLCPVRDGSCGLPGPVADRATSTIKLPKHPVFYFPAVLAHEYAHFLTEATDFTEEFETTYRDCCYTVGALPLPTGELGRLIRREWEIAKGAARL